MYSVSGSVNWSGVTYVLPVKSGRMSLSATPPPGLAQCRVGSTGRICGKYSPLASVSSLIHLIRVGLPAFASMVSEGAL